MKILASPTLETEERGRDAHTKAILRDLCDAAGFPPDAEVSIVELRNVIARMYAHSVAAMEGKRGRFLSELGELPVLHADVPNNLDSTGSESPTLESL